MSCKLVPASETGNLRPWILRAPGGNAAPLAPEGERRHAALEEREQAAAELRQGLDQAWKQGFVAGQEELHRQDQARIDEVIRHLAESVESLASLRARIRKEAEDEILKLVFGLARRVVRRELTLDPDAVSGILRVCLERAKQQDLIRVKAHASLLESIRHQLEQAGLKDVDIVSDPDMQPGDVVFETERGTLDARIESQFQEIERGLADQA